MVIVSAIQNRYLTHNYDVNLDEEQKIPRRLKATLAKNDFG